MNYTEAKQIAQTLWDASRTSSAVLNGFPKGSMGLTPDSVRATPEWKVAKAQEDSDFKKLQNWNTFYVKTFKKEINAERAAKYATLSK